MNAHDTRVLKASLSDLRAGRVEEAAAALEKLLPVKRAPRAVVGTETLKESRERRRETVREKRASVREQVERRADGKCEVAPFMPGIACMGALEMDHWEGGSGRKSAEESPDTCWILCNRHHHWRTNNAPSAEKWNQARAAFCAEMALPFRPHIEKAAL